MNVWRVSSGIVSMIFCVILTIQSYATELASAEESGTDGTGGMIMAVLMLTAGIVSVAGRKAEGTIIPIILIVLYGTTSLTGYLFSPSFDDLILWANWGLIGIGTAVLSLVNPTVGSSHHGKED